MNDPEQNLLERRQGDTPSMPEQNLLDRVEELEQLIKVFGQQCARLEKRVEEEAEHYG